MTAPRDNPFNMQRLEQLAFEPQGVTWSGLLDRLDALNHRAAIVGPHGSGKTTLLLQLRDTLEQRGRPTALLFRNTDGGPALPDSWRPTLESLDPEAVLLIDGYDHLSWPARTHLRKHRRLIVTTHRRAMLPTLIRTRTSPRLLHQLANRLQTGAIDPHHAAALHATHGGNVRDALRALYDRY